MNFSLRLAIIVSGFLNEILYVYSIWIFRQLASE